MRARTEDRPFRDECLEPCAAASMTKVSKPVLFALKMTDLQSAHKQDSLPTTGASAHSDEPQAYFSPNPRMSTRFPHHPPKFIATRRGRALPLDGEAPSTQQIAPGRRDGIKRLCCQ